MRDHFAAGETRPPLTAERGPPCRFAKLIRFAAGDTRPHLRLLLERDPPAWSDRFAKTEVVRFAAGKTRPHRRLLLERDPPALRDRFAMSRRKADEYVPVRAVGSGTEFDNEIWYELISTIKTVNNLPVEDRHTPLGKSDLKDGDRVTVEYEGKTFEGVVDLESLSPPDSPAERTPSKLPANSKAWKRKRVCPTRYRDEIAAPKPKKRLVEKKSGM